MKFAAIRIQRTKDAIVAADLVELDGIVRLWDSNDEVQAWACNQDDSDSAADEVHYLTGEHAELEDAIQTCQEIGEEIAQSHGCTVADIDRWLTAYSYFPAAAEILGHDLAVFFAHRGARGVAR